jgi:hypothetical protein
MEDNERSNEVKLRGSIEESAMSGKLGDGITVWKYETVHSKESVSR